MGETDPNTTINSSSLSMGLPLGEQSRRENSNGKTIVVVAVAEIVTNTTPDEQCGLSQASDR